jgi:hypothetical protein
LRWSETQWSTEFSKAQAPKTKVRKRTGHLALKDKCANKRWYPRVMLIPVAMNMKAKTAT